MLCCIHVSPCTCTTRHHTHTHLLPHDDQYYTCIGSCFPHPLPRILGDMVCRPPITCLLMFNRLSLMSRPLSPCLSCSLNPHMSPAVHRMCLMPRSCLCSLNPHMRLDVHHMCLMSRPFSPSHSKSVSCVCAQHTCVVLIYTRTVICWLGLVYDVCDWGLVLRIGLCSAVGNAKSWTEMRNRECVDGNKKSWTAMRNRGCVDGNKKSWKEMRNRGRK